MCQAWLEEDEYWDPTEICSKLDTKGAKSTMYTESMHEQFDDNVLECANSCSGCREGSEMKGRVWIWRKKS